MTSVLRAGLHFLNTETGDYYIYAFDGIPIVKLLDIGYIDTHGGKHTVASYIGHAWYLYQPSTKQHWDDRPFDEVSFISQVSITLREEC